MLENKISNLHNLLFQIDKIRLTLAILKNKQRLFNIIAILWISMITIVHIKNFTIP